MLLKKFGLERVVTRNFLLNGRLIFKSGLEMFQKGGNDEKGVEKLATLSVANLKR